MPLYIGICTDFDKFSTEELKFVKSFSLAMLAGAAGISSIQNAKNDFFRLRVTLELRGDMFANWYLEVVRTMLTWSLVVRMRDAGWNTNDVNESNGEWWNRMAATCCNREGRPEVLRAYAPPVVTPAKLEILCAKQLWLQHERRNLPEKAETGLKRLESLLNLQSGGTLDRTKVGTARSAFATEDGRSDKAFPRAPEAARREPRF